MMNNKFKTIVAAGTGVALSLVLTEANPAQAATVSYDFSVDIKQGPLTGNTYTGFFSYDDQSEPVGFGYGSEEFYLTEFEYNFNGFNYTLDNPRVVPEGLQVVGQTFSAISNNSNEPFFVSGNFNPAIKPTLVGGSLTNGASGYRDWFFGASVFAPGQNEFEYRQDGPSPYRGDVNYVLRPTQVPEPANAVALSLLGLGMLLTRKKIASRQRNYLNPLPPKEY